MTPLYKKEAHKSSLTSIKHGTGKSTSGNMVKKNQTVCLREAIRDIQNKASKDRSHGHHLLQVPSLKKISPNLDPLHMEINMNRT